MKAAFFFLALPLIAQAKTFTLVDEATKEKFVCTSQEEKKEEKERDPECIGKLVEVCRSKNASSNSACFDLATRKCKDAPANFVTCVKSTQKACQDTSSGSSTSCFERALQECR